MDLLRAYSQVVGEDVIDQLVQLAKPLQGLRMVHVNSTREGGGVAEILHKLLPLKEALGIRSSWEVITGDAEFYRCTKTFHNALQGNAVTPTNSMLKAYEDANEKFAAENRELLQNADFVFIHDPQPAPSLKSISDRKGKWVW